MAVNTSNIAQRLENLAILTVICNILIVGSIHIYYTSTCILPPPHQQCCMDFLEDCRGGFTYEFKLPFFEEGIFRGKSSFLGRVSLSEPFCNCLSECLNALVLNELYEPKLVYMYIISLSNTGISFQ